MTRQRFTFGPCGKKYVAFVLGAAAWAACFPSLPPESDDTSAGSDNGSAGHLDDSADGSGDAAESETAVGRACATDEDCNELNTNCGSGVCGADRTCRLITRDGVRCDDGLSCTHSDTCVGATCTGVRYVCTAPGPCASSVCDGVGTCNITIVAGACLIDGSCVTEGATHPSNVCERCNSENPTEWAAFDGRNCDDGNICTTNDICSDRQCIGQGLPDDSAFDWAVRLPFGTTGSPSRVRAALGTTVVYSGEDRVSAYVGVNSTWSVRDVTPESGAPEPGRLYMLGATDNAIWLASHCSRELRMGVAPLSTPTTPASHTWCIFELSASGALISSARVLMRPERRLGNGDLLGITDNSVRRFTQGGTIVWEKPFGGRLLDVAETLDGDLVLVLFGDPILPEDRQKPSFGPFQHLSGTMLLVRTDESGTGRWAKAVYTHPERDFRGDTAHLAVHPSGEITIAGTLYASSDVWFGESPETERYVPRGVFSYDPPLIGAGGDGFLVRYTAGGTPRYRWFLTPGDSIGGFFSVSSVSEETLVSGWYREQAMLQGPATIRLLADAAGPVVGERPGSAFLRIDQEGALRWHRGHPGMSTGFLRSPTSPLMVATVDVISGDVGFPSNVFFRDIQSGGVFGLGFNTVGGFECSQNDN